MYRRFTPDQLEELSRKIENEKRILKLEKELKRIENAEKVGISLYQEEHLS